MVCSKLKAFCLTNAKIWGRANNYNLISASVCYFEGARCTSSCGALYKIDQSGYHKYYDFLYCKIDTLNF